MNNEIKELAERVRLTDEEIDAASIWGAKTVAEAQLNKVLNDPDLALIDREGEQEKIYENSLDCMLCTCPPVIPLAKLKELK